MMIVSSPEPGAFLPLFKRALTLTQIPTTSLDKITCITQSNSHPKRTMSCRCLSKGIQKPSAKAFSSKNVYTSWNHAHITGTMWARSNKSHAQSLPECSQLAELTRCVHAQCVRLDNTKNSSVSITRRIWKLIPASQRKTNWTSSPGDGVVLNASKWIPDLHQKWLLSTTMLWSLTSKAGWTVAQSCPLDNTPRRNKDNINHRFVILLFCFTWNAKLCSRYKILLRVINIFRSTCCLWSPMLRIFLWPITRVLTDSDTLAFMTNTTASSQMQASLVHATNFALARNLDSVQSSTNQSPNRTNCWKPCNLKWALRNPLESLAPIPMIRTCAMHHRWQPMRVHQLIEWMLWCSGRTLYAATAQRSTAEIEHQWKALPHKDLIS